jgi:hypothetical protein
VHNAIPTRLASQLLRALVSFLCSITFLASAAPVVRAEPCFPDVYYKKMFKPLKLEVMSAGDSRLKAYSDYVTSKGKDPHSGTNEGCMCGVNNGRWDQLLANTSLEDPERVPVWFRLKRITIEPFDKMNKPIGKTIRISAEKLNSCYGSPATVPDHRPFNATGGNSDKPDALEPGESIISCTCLAPSDRGKSGYAKVTVAYDPNIWAANVLKAAVVEKVNPDAVRWKADFTLRDLAKGEGRYFAIRIPKDGESVWSDLAVSLKESVGTVLLARSSTQGWSWNQNKWKKGRLNVSPPKGGLTYWLLVRSLGEKGSGNLEIRYVTRSKRSQALARKSGAQKDTPNIYQEVTVGGSTATSFRAYLLGLGAPKSQPKKAVAFKDKCCSGDTDN